MNRAEWHKYLNEKGIRHMFFSALSEQEKINLLPDEEINTQKKITEKEIDEEWKSLMRGEDAAPKKEKEEKKPSKKEQFKTKRERKLEESEALDKKLKSQNQKSGTTTTDVKYVDFMKIAGESSGYETVSDEEDDQPEKKPEETKQSAEPSKTQTEKSEEKSTGPVETTQDTKALETEKQNSVDSKPQEQAAEQKDQPTEPKQQEKAIVEEEEDGELYCNRNNLLIKLKQIVNEEKKIKPHKGTYVIGMVGFPNVGKSSVINVLCKRKLVGVGSQPGKTKHFQTLYIEKDLLLCDCPGLVFPSFTASRAEMVNLIHVLPLR